LGRFCSRDPVGYGAGSNLHIAIFVVNGVDPYGELEWSHRVEVEPNLDGEFGLGMKVLQELTSQPPKLFPKHTQSWQTNDVRSFALVSRGTTCQWGANSTRRLDVNDIEHTPVKITDTIRVDPDPKKPPQSYCLFVQMVKKKLGLSSLGAGKLRVRSNYEPTDEEWSLANRMVAPVLNADMTYLFYDRTNCCACTPEQLAKVDSLFDQIYGGVIDPSVYAIESVTYADLGTWTVHVGR
jgi:hypothetical protein